MQWWRLRPAVMARWWRHLRIVSRLLWLLFLDRRNAAIWNPNLASLNLVSVLCLTKRAQRSIRRNGRHGRLEVLTPVLFGAVCVCGVVSVVVGHVELPYAKLRRRLGWVASATTGQRAPGSCLGSVRNCKSLPVMRSGDASLQSTSNRRVSPAAKVNKGYVDALVL